MARRPAGTRALLLLLLSSVLPVISMTGGTRAPPEPGARPSRGAWPCPAAGPRKGSQRRPRHSLTLSLRGAGVEGEGEASHRPNGDSEDIAALEDMLEQVRRPVA